jgi:hypothetical protein
VLESRAELESIPPPSDGLVGAVRRDKAGQLAVIVEP